MDRFNKLALGTVSSVQYAIRTERWQVRFFLALLAICETNAFLAHNTRRQRVGDPLLSRMSWKQQLAIELAEFHTNRGKRMRAPVSEGEPTLQ